MPDALGAPADVVDLASRGLGDLMSCYEEFGGGKTECAMPMECPVLTNARGLLAEVERNHASFIATGLLVRIREALGKGAPESPEAPE